MPAQITPKTDLMNRELSQLKAPHGYSRGSSGYCVGSRDDAYAELERIENATKNEPHSADRSRN